MSATLTNAAEATARATRTKTTIAMKAATAPVAGRRHAKGGGKCRAGVPGAEAVMRTFASQGEAVQTTGLTDGMEAVLAARQNLVDINLVADIPDEFVFRRFKNMVQRQGQLDDAESRAAEAIVRVAELEAELDVLRAEVDSLRAAAARAATRSA